MISNLYLLVFAIAFMGCVLATPLVTRIAGWLGAIDKPDHFRRVHAGAVPRMGGLGLAVGIAAAVAITHWNGHLQGWIGYGSWSGQLTTVLAAGLLVLSIGVIDDARGMGPRAKLVGQALAVLVLYLGGVRVETFTILGYGFDFSGGPLSTVVSLGVPDLELRISAAGFVLTMLWFLGCMNIWNLIDGMDGLASGVGLLVAATLMLVAIHLDNVGAALLAAALAGGLAGFLLYNWHPACIFLGDSGSLLIGLLIGVIGVQGSLKGSAAASILLPILAMGLPISDTALAIFRRWVRNLPLTAADRRHVHHLLIGLGLDARQAAALLYCFSGFLCGAVLLGVALNNEVLALVLGVSGCLAFLVVLTSRRDELRHLREDLSARMSRGRQERFAAQLAWEAIQRIELCPGSGRLWEVVAESAGRMGARGVALTCWRDGTLVFEDDTRPFVLEGVPPRTSDPSATFQLAVGESLALRLSVTLDSEAWLAPDIAYRFLLSLAQAATERISELLDVAVEPIGEDVPASPLLAPAGLPSAEAGPRSDVMPPITTPLAQSLG